MYKSMGIRLVASRKATRETRWANRLDLSNLKIIRPASRFFKPTLTMGRKHYRPIYANKHLLTFPHPRCAEALILAPSDPSDNAFYDNLLFNHQLLSSNALGPRVWSATLGERSVLVAEKVFGTNLEAMIQQRSLDKNAAVAIMDMLDNMARNRLGFTKFELQSIMLGFSKFHPDTSRVYVTTGENLKVYDPETSYPMLRSTLQHLPIPIQTPEFFRKIGIDPPAVGLSTYLDIVSRGYRPHELSFLLALLRRPHTDR